MANKSSKTKVEEPQQMKFLDLVSHPEFEKVLSGMIKELIWSRENAEKIKAEAERLIKQVEYAQNNTVKAVLKQYEKPEDFVQEYILVATKKSKLSSAKRQVIGQIGESACRAATISIMNKKAEDEAKKKEAKAKKTAKTSKKEEPCAE